MLHWSQGRVFKRGRGKLSVLETYFIMLRNKLFLIYNWSFLMWQFSIESHNWTLTLSIYLHLYLYTYIFYSQIMTKRLSLWKSKLLCKWFTLYCVTGWAF
jgi:hypothetical protein